MTKIKALFGLTALVALLAISAAPASALFESTSTKTSGVGTAGKGTFTTGTLSVTCESAEGEWKTGATTKSETLNILAKKWNKCKNSIFGSAEVSECEFQIKQKEGQTTNLLGKVITGCTVKALGCVITVAAEGNKELGKVTLETSETTNSKEKVEVSEILGTYKGCNLEEKLKTGKEVVILLQLGQKTK
jgi:hypothetical protein